MEEKHNILKKAEKIINGERQDQYGKPEDSFGIIAEYWNAYLRRKYDWVDVALRLDAIMISLKHTPA
jgi:hypothetical protein